MVTFKCNPVFRAMYIRDYTLSVQNIMNTCSLHDINSRWIQVKAMIPYWCHLLNPLQSVWIMGRRRVKEGFLSLETFEIWIAPFRGWMGKTKYWSAFDQDMVQFPVCIKNSPPPKGHPANLTQPWESLESTWASIPVDCFRHRVESMLRQIEAVLFNLLSRLISSMFLVLTVATRM